VPNAIELRGITKRFPGVVANDRISIAVEQGEIHALAGENGAGKTTLMNIIYGLYQPDEGEILIHGKPVAFQSSRDSIARKIGMVHQHFMLVPKLTVTENIILGREIGSKLKIDRKAAAAKIREISERHGLSIDPDRKVSELSVTQQQRVEILKVLYREAEILIFDEPTAVLTPQEIDEFCDILLGLKAQGKTIIFISHKLAEVLKVSDHITVIRHGKVVGTVPQAETSSAELTRMMVGRDVDLGRIEREATTSEQVLLEAKNLNYTNRERVQKLQDVSFSLRSGEILGVAGVDGNGQEELVQIICGKLAADGGSVLLSGEDITRRSIRSRREQGLGFIPEDRHKDGLVLEYTIAENLVLGSHYQSEFARRRIWLNQKQIQKNAEERRTGFDIRCPNVAVAAGTLSGGNQQKVVIARESGKEPEVIVAVQPTRGLDVGAIEFVQNNLIEQRNSGRGVLLFSLELDEILSVSDRIAVMYRGKIVAVVDAEAVTRQELGLLMLQGSGKGEMIS